MFLVRSVQAIIVIFALSISPVSLAGNHDDTDGLTPPHEHGEQQSRRGCLKTLWKLGVYGAVSIVATSAGLVVTEELNEDPDTAQTPDYLTVASGTRLNVAVLGDSISSGYPPDDSVGIIPYIKASRWTRLGGWALDVDQSDSSIKSLFETLGEQYPTKLAVYARSGAYVDGASPLNRTAANILRNITNFKGQVDRAISQKDFPNLFILWAGHNNMDWVYDIQEVKSLTEKEHYENIPHLVTAEYVKQLERLVSESDKRGKPTEMIVLGLLNFEKAFQARNAAEKLRQADSTLFPGFEAVYQAWPSVHPNYHEKTAALVKRTNHELREAVENLNERLIRDHSTVRLRYSDALFEVDISDPKYLHPIDGLHPSRLAHKKFAEAMQDVIQPSVEALLGQRK